ncbi:hypothetical protein LIA77_09100 [Sarocladium implicatum]|nr:hypothetical protein LIA77_09100 [Sarocladium implicatum]
MLSRRDDYSCSHRSRSLMHTRRSTSAAVRLGRGLDQALCLVAINQLVHLFPEKRRVSLVSTGGIRRFRASSVLGRIWGRGRHPYSTSDAGPQPSRRHRRQPPRRVSGAFCSSVLKLGCALRESRQSIFRADLIRKAVETTATSTVRISRPRSFGSRPWVILPCNHTPHPLKTSNHLTKGTSSQAHWKHGFFSEGTISPTLYQKRPRRVGLDTQARGLWL